MDMNFSPAHDAFRAEVRAFLDAELLPHLRDGARRTPSVFVEPDIGLEWQRILHRKGWLAYHWPQADGGCNWDPVQKYIFETECALADAPALSVLGLRLVGPVICAFGTPEQKARFLPRMLSGEDQWCQGYSEPGSGSDLASLKTRAVRQPGVSPGEGDKYIVNGSKIWTTHAHYADWMFCLARTNAHVKPQAGISFLLLRMDQPGVTVRPIITMAGDHEVNQVFLDNVEARVADRLGEEGQGWTIAKYLLENERGGSSTAPRLLAGVRRLRGHAQAQPSGTNGSLGSQRRFQERLARLELEIQAFEVTELRILAEIIAGRDPGPQTSMIKLVSSEIGQQLDALAVEIFGYAGLQLPLERPLYGNAAPEPMGSVPAQQAMPKYLNGRAWTIFGGTSEVQRNIIAKTVLGL